MGNTCITSKKRATTGKPSSGGSFTASGSRSTSDQFDEGEYPDGRILEAANLCTYSLLQLKKATYNFRPDDILGAGGFGAVYKGWLDPPTRKGNCLVVGVKKLNSRSTQGLEEWQSEINFLGRLSQPNLVKLLGHCSEDNEYLLVYEFMAKGSLKSHIFRRCVPLSWELRLNIVIGAARGLAFLHAQQLIYRDFKASNILLDENYNAKLSDFGLVKLGPTGNKSHISTTVMGTYGYAAPEYLATGHLYVKSDVYGFGVVLLEMLSGKRALDLKRPDEGSLADWIKQYLISHRRLAPLMDLRFEGQYNSKQAFQATQLTLNCVADEPRNRPSMKEVVERLEQTESRAQEARGSGSRSSQDQHHDHTGAAHQRLPRAGDDPHGRNRARAV